MTIRLAVFDIDGTLAATEESIPPHIGVKLRFFENQGLRIAFISGRTASYLAGLARGIGIGKPLVAGENGGVIFDPGSKWERFLDAVPHHEAEEMKNILLEEFGGLWFQPNQTMLTAAPRDLSRIEQLYSFVLSLKAVREKKYKINKYYDAVEIMPQQNSKGKALAVIKEVLGIRKEEVVVFGNTEVDLPMKNETDRFIIIGDNPQGEGIMNFRTVEDALDYLKSHI